MFALRFIRCCRGAPWAPLLSLTSVPADIVLAFYHPAKRQYTEFAVA